jgi:hypothetical protein
LRWATLADDMVAQGTARITRAVTDDDRAAVARHAIAIGYAADGGTRELLEPRRTSSCSVCQPLRHVGRYDFAA